MIELGGAGGVNGGARPSQEHSGIAAMLQALVGTPAGSLVALLSLLSSLAKSVATLGVDPMLADAITLCLSLVAAALFTRSLYQKLRQPLSALAPEAGHAAQAARRGAVAMMASLAILPVSLAIWTCRPLLVHGLERRPWIFCGTVNVCANGCVKLLDSQERKISDCLTAQDDTGYVEVRRAHWYLYKPRVLSVACPGLPTKKLAIPTAMMLPNCGGVLEIR